MRSGSASPMTALRASSPTTGNASSRSRSARGSSAACCSRRSTGARRPRRARASARWWRPSPIRFPASPRTRRRRPRSRLTNMSFAVSRCRGRKLTLPDHVWWTRVAVTGGYGYLFADNADLARWQSWLRSVAGGDLAEYRDFGGGVYRAAAFAGDRIETCLFVGPAHDAGDWEVVKNLFAADALSDDQRRMLLSGRSDRRARQRRSDRLRLFRRRPQHDLRRDRGRRAHGRRRSARSSRPAPIAAPAFRN